MSTYAVFGMTRARAVEMARKRVPTSKKDPLNPRSVIGLSEREWEEAVQAEADKIMAGQQTTQLSDKFDAPHFAFDYLALARKSGGRGLHVKSYAKTGKRSATTGKPLFAWTLVNEADLKRSA